MRKTQIAVIAMLLGGPVWAVDMHIESIDDDAVIQSGRGMNYYTGRYQKPLELKGLSDVEISATPGSTVVFDGSDPLDDLVWERHSGDVYRAKLDKPISQLFCDDAMMTPARWPNAHMTDANFFKIKDTWRAMVKGEGYTFGHVTDADPTPEGGKSVYAQTPDANHQTLAGTGIDMTGAVAIMNIGSWMSYASRITEHAAGRDSFAYDAEFKESDEKARDEALALAPGAKFGRMSSGKGAWHPHYYMIEGLQCLDRPREYWYDKDSGFLYFHSPDGASPASHKLRGKRRSLMLTLTGCRNVTVRGIDFFASTFSMDGCSGCVIEDAELRSPTHNEFQTGNLGFFTRTRIGGPPEPRPGEPSNTIRNCRFSYFDGEALIGSDVRVENCLFHDFQYSCLGFAFAMRPGDNSVLRRCAVYRCGASEGYRGSKSYNTMEYCRIYDHGGLQHDGSCFQSGGRGKNLYYRNWVHDTPKIAYRFDSGDNVVDPNGYGQIVQNVAWDVGRGCQIKGDDHLAANNLILGAMLELNTNVERWKSTNDRTVTINNIATSINERGVQTTNVVGQTIAGALRDPTNWDFRPKAGSKLIGGASPVTPDVLPKGFPVEWVDVDALATLRDIGPYQSADKRYWIAGFQDEVASTPIPRQDGKDVPLDTDLMFLEAYRCSQHRVFLGEKSKALELITNLRDTTTNIVTPPPLKAKTTYIWRVDAVAGDGSIKSGSRWRFTTR